ncbi:MAG: TolC family protein [Bacteroidota bacterium]
MNTYKNISFLMICFLAGFVIDPVEAQDSLSLEQAFEIALNNNYDLQVSRNSNEQLKNLATKGNAGLLPSLQANGNFSYSNNSVLVEFAPQSMTPEIRQSGAATWVLAGSLDLNYTIFNGFSGMRNYQRLRLNAERGDEQTRQAIEGVLINVARSYYALAQLSLALDLSRQNLQISYERLERAENKNEFGVANKLEVLNAQVDINTDSVSVINAEINLENAKRDFNQLLGRAIEVDYEVSRQMSGGMNLSREEILKSAEANNIDLILARSNKNLAVLDKKINESSRMPRLNASASYGYNRTDNEFGFTVLNRTNGLTLGLNLVFDIYGGGQKNTQIQNAKIAVNNADVQYNSVLSQIKRDVINAYRLYESNRFILQVEEQSVVTARANFDRTKEQFGFGQINNTQFREAQLNLLNAQNRLNNAAYNLKISEIELIKLKGDVLNQE